ncbi:hypothetical protein [Serratia marcescens]|uniref:hypothetical protein n=1 Tax=Serratia marcescens TaxID=615 RepID=UPI003A8AED37
MSTSCSAVVHRCQPAGNPSANVPHFLYRHVRHQASLAYRRTQVDHAAGLVPGLGGVIGQRFGRRDTDADRQVGTK